MTTEDRIKLSEIIGKLSLIDASAKVMKDEIPEAAKELLDGLREDVATLKQIRDRG